MTENPKLEQILDNLPYVPVGNTIDPATILLGYTDREWNINLVCKGNSCCMYTFHGTYWIPALLALWAYDALQQAQPGEWVKPRQKWLKRLTDDELQKVFKKLGSHDSTQG